jgi:hypothetical protein
LDGGDFTLLDKSRAFEVDALLEQLEALKEADFLPVSVDNDDLDLLLREIEERKAVENFDWDTFENAEKPDVVEKDIDNEEDHECPKCGYQWTK